MTRVVAVLVTAAAAIGLPGSGASSRPSSAVGDPDAALAAAVATVVGGAGPASVARMVDGLVAQWRQIPEAAAGRALPGEVQCAIRGNHRELIQWLLLHRSSSCADVVGRLKRQLACVDWAQKEEGGTSHRTNNGQRNAAVDHGPCLRCMRQVPAGSASTPPAVGAGPELETRRQRLASPALRRHPGLSGTL